MKYTKLMMITLVAGLLMLNGCMLKHVFSDDEGAGMHGGMHEGGMQHEGMMMPSGDEDE